MQHRIKGFLSGKYAKFVTEANFVMDAATVMQHGIVGYILERLPVAVAVIGSNLSAYKLNLSAYYFFLIYLFFLFFLLINYLFRAVIG
jgi:hypothetical protein